MIPLLLALSTAAHAHAPGLSYGTLTHDDIHLVFAASDAPEGAPDLGLSVDEAPCTLGPWHTEAVAGDGVAWTASVACPPGARTYSARFTADLSPGHRHVVQAGGATAMLHAGADTTTLDVREGVLGVLTRFARLGIEHIVTGYDHLLFLVALLLGARRLKDMLAVVSGFTVAHSITLAASALGWATIPGAVIEPLIALSIALAALENLTDASLRRRLALTFGLGLVHGFGLAGMLTELGLPPGARAEALLAFNGGVEIGQLAVVLAVMPVLTWLHRTEGWRARWVPAASVGLAAVGVIWFAARVI